MMTHSRTDSVSGGSNPPTATRFFLIWFFHYEQRAQVEKQPQLVYNYHLRHAVMRYVGTRQSRFAHSLPRIVSIEHYVLNFNGGCNGSIPFLSLGFIPIKPPSLIQQ